MSTDVITIEGGVPLHGVVGNSGSKNAALPIMAACILADQPVVLENVPEVGDVATLSLLLGHLGVEVKRRTDRSVHINTVDPSAIVAETELVSRMRASCCVLGPLLARRRKAVVALPGGCRLGPRPIDLHLKGLAALGADIRIKNDYVVAESNGLHGATIDLSGPRGPTVTGTANVLMAAVLASGETIIYGAAREPEIVDLGEFLVSLGARIDGLGTSKLRIRGVEQLGGGTYRIIPDRIEAGTLLVAGAITGGDVTLRGCRPDHLDAVLAVLDDAGAILETGRDWIRVAGPQRANSFHFTALPYPGVPTDLQPHLTALAAVASGQSSIGDRVFPERMGHVDALRQLGACIERGGSSLTIDGIGQLRGATVTATDLRAGAALMLAGLAAEGTTTVCDLPHVWRGYEGFAQKLWALGATLNGGDRLTASGGRFPSGYGDERIGDVRKHRTSRPSSRTIAVTAPQCAVFSTAAS